MERADKASRSPTAKRSDAKRAEAKRADVGQIRRKNEAGILRAATLLFSRNGFQGVRIAEVAEEAGLPKANIYYYFTSKEAIYTGILKKLIAGWDEALEEIRPDRSPREALEAYVRAKIDYSRRNPEESRLFAAELQSGAPFLSEEDREHMREATDKRVAVVEDWIARGLMKPINPRHLFIILWSSTQFYIDSDKLACDALRVATLSDADYDEAASTIVETVVGSVTG
ncbi:TetR family transcriptional regulator C-terminal domain-containing protein [Rhizobium sp. NPDC090275]|uniref:TetR family transcriptional regulator C-terminal domain-containing protein n=1 Tax=Rhizobium sp. NPDC090275 TaxID=3364498 RepID=UPI00383A8CDF